MATDPACGMQVDVSAAAGSSVFEGSTHYVCSAAARRHSSYGLVASQNGTIKHIFPGGYIPSLAETLIDLERYGLDVRSIENMSYHYHCTVDRWLKNLEAH